MRAMQKDVTMLSGDHNTIAEEVCRQVGIAPDRCFARLLPQQKCDWIRSAQATPPPPTPTPTQTQGEGRPTYGDLDMVPNTEAMGPDLEEAADPDPDPVPASPSRPAAPRGPLRVLMIGDGMPLLPLPVSAPR